MSNPAVDDLAVTFPRTVRWDLTNARAVRGWCVEVSEAFVEYARSCGVRAAMVHGARFGSMPQFPQVELLLEAHTAVLLTDTDTVVDWTARQFDPDAPVPLVEPLDRWRVRWAPVAGSTARP